MITINVNSAASRAGINLGNSQDALSASLERLSSGRRIVDPSDDAGGLAVHMKMAAAQKRTEATAINLRNARSYLEVQDGSLQVASNVASRMSELFALARDVTKNNGDIENYDKEVSVLRQQLVSLATEKFNGVNLFESSGLTIPTSEDGSQTTQVTSALINSDPMMHMMVNGFQTFKIGGKTYLATHFDMPSPPSIGTTASTMAAYEIPGGIASPVELRFTSSTSVNTAQTTATTTFSISVNVPAGSQAQANSGTVTDDYTVTGSTVANTSYTTIQADYQQSVLDLESSDEWSFLSQEALQQIADMRAQNGAEMSRINFAEDMLRINAVNLEAANSRIIDVDVAAESTQLARYQILQQAGTAMLAQANTSQQSLVRLLQG
jgi:flagellin